MKVLFVTRGFPSDKDPMSGNYEAVQAKAIAAKGHEVAVIAVRWLNLLHIFCDKKVRSRVVNNIRIYECNRIKLSIPHVYFPKFELWVQKWQFKKVYNQCVQDIGTPDIVHAHILMCAAPATYLKQELHLPFVITEHWSRAFSEHMLKRVVNLTPAYHIADKVICVSKALSENLRQKCGLDSIVINNMVSNEFFRTRKKKNQSDSFKFIAVGSVKRVKRFDLLVEAFALCQFPKNVILEIVGEGPERALIAGMVQELYLSDQVKLLGMKTPEELSDLLCQSDCFVLSSHLETFSIVLIEAMAKGLPIIATKCGGPETFIRTEDGLLIEKDNVKEMAEALKYMLNHVNEYNSEEIRQHCYDHFSQDVIADMIINVYNQVIK
ncbi:MAG: glycosyltransferase family 4 protein [Bacteroidaceae bacterium]|nr:glycosyltransferase family 4 protein [Bacteroidaceae bacterium]